MSAKVIILMATYNGEGVFGAAASIYSVPDSWKLASVCAR